ncbi:MAG: hypothetical protein ABSF22_06650 [Bryobacteraceae bacterium]
MIRSSLFLLSIPGLFAQLRPAHPARLAVDSPFRFTYSLPSGVLVSVATVDSAGDVYFGGTTGVALPTTQGAFQSTFSACADNNPIVQPGCKWAFVGKLSPAGSLIWLTYLADLNGNSTISAIAADTKGKVYVAGTASPIGNLPPAFPVTPGAFSTTGPGPNQSGNFLAELNSTGTGLIYGTYFFANLRIVALVPDGNGSLYFGVDVPGTISVPQVNPLPGMAASTSQAAYVAKMNPTGTALSFATWINSTAGSESGLGNLATDALGNLYIAGGCYNVGVQCVPTTPGAFQTSLSGPSEIFAMKLTAAGSMVYSTLLAGSGTQTVGGIAADADGNLTIVGALDGTSTSDFPVTPNAFQTSAVLLDRESLSSGFVAKLNPAGSALVYSTYFTGTSGEDEVTSVFLDTSGNAIFEGLSYSPDLPVTPDAWIPCHPAPNFQYANDPEANYIARLSADGQSLVYSTFIGSLPNGMVADGLGFAGLDAGNDLYFFVESVILRYHITERPNGSVACVANASHGYESALAPLEMVRIRGNDVAGGRSMGTTLSGGTLPASDQGLQVLMNGQVAPLIEVEPDQITVVAPAELPVSGTVTVKVLQNGNAAELPVVAQAAAPGIITTDGLAYGDAVALNQDGTANSHTNLAAPGSVISLFMTGLGATSPLLQAGTVASGSGALAPGASLQVTLYRSICPVIYAGPAPGQLAGIYQVNIQVPATGIMDWVPMGVAAFDQLGQSQLGNYTVGFYVSCPAGSTCVLW